MSPFYSCRSVPAHSVLLMRTREEARAFPRGDLSLWLCRSCGFISNAAFDPKLEAYSMSYEETQSFSPTFRSFHERLSRRLIEKFQLRGKTVIEIGCGKGEFISMLCEMGPNSGTGFDPAYVADRNTSSARDRVTFINDFFSERYSHYRADLICCKMTLEHIPNPGEFLRMIRRCSDPGTRTALFVQVPNARKILEDVAFWDIYYEHCSYFSRESLVRLFQDTGFRVLDAATEYDDQYLTIEAEIGPSTCVRPSGTRESAADLDEWMACAERFSTCCPLRIERWRSLLGALGRQGKRVVLWGGGSKAVAFLNAVDGSDVIEYVVDINPYRQGTYIAGTGQQIVGPAFLRDYRPDLAILMNPVYLAEVHREIEDLSPRTRLLPVEGG